MNANLFAAIEANEPELVRAVLAAGADAAQPTPNGVTALSLAAARDQVECVRALLEAGADVDQGDDTVMPLAIERASH